MKTMNSHLSSASLTRLLLLHCLLLLAGFWGSISAQQPLSQELPLPSVPTTLRTPHERAAYILAHFWDGLDFADTLRSRRPDFVEQNLANFLSLFPHAQEEARTAAVRRLMQRAEADKPAYLLLAELSEKYLYTPGSPMQSEEHFIPFLEELARTPILDDTEKSRPRFLLSAARKNRPGTTAADFAYHTAEGRRQTLHTTPSAPLLLLLFYNPDCRHCQETMARLHADPLIRESLQNNRLTLLAIDVEANPGITDRELYILPTMPTLYLLDGEKRVILKETKVDSVLLHLPPPSPGLHRPR